MANSLYRFSNQPASPKWTMRGADRGRGVRVNENPGPGAYTSTSQLGMKFERVPAPAFGQGKRDREIKGNFVGPGQYNTTIELHRPTSVRGPLARAERRVGNSNRSFEPGPGSYSIPSSFGRAAPGYTQSKGGRNVRGVNGDTPGPGAYSVSDKIASKKLTWKPEVSGKSAASFSFSKSQRSFAPRRSGPGPGSYEPRKVVTKEPAFTMRGKFNPKPRVNAGEFASGANYSCFA